MLKILKVIIIFSLVLVLLAWGGSFLFEKIYKFPEEVKYGVTFAPRYARYLKLDWQKTYIQMLDEMKMLNLRLPTYWDLLEPDEGKYNFSETDFMLFEAEKRNAEVILVLGMRQPRWPECQVPQWAKSLSVKARQEKILILIKQVVERYKDNKAVKVWQVENEPFLPFFGEGCDRADAGFLKREVDLVKNMSNKKILVTDSGELGAWIIPMHLSDIFGTTLYRDVYNPVMGYVNYPVLPYFYNIHSVLVRSFFAPKNEKTVIIELQAEPWFSGGDLSADFDRQAKLFPVQKLKSYVNYARKTGFDEMYLWGVEWWYAMAAKGYPQYLEYAQILFK